MHGEGTYCWPNGSKYIGTWSFDEHNGYGTYTCPGMEDAIGNKQAVNAMKENGKIMLVMDKDLRNGLLVTLTTENGKKIRNKEKGYLRGLTEISITVTKYSVYHLMYSGEWFEGKKVGKGILVCKGKVYAIEWGERELASETDKGKDRLRISFTHWRT